jgi:perosamine synthetase
MDAIHAVAAAADLVVIEDAPHAAGAGYRGRRIGTLSRLTCFSFHAAKNMTTGEGGAITCASASDAARLRRLRVLGMSRDTFGRRRSPGVRGGWPWQYEVRELGSALNARRRVLAARYVEAFADCDWIETPRVAPWADSAYYSFPIRVRARAALARHCAARGIVTGVHYRPLHRQPLYRDRAATLPVTDALWRRILLLPLHPGLGRDAQERVIAAVRSFDRRPR